MVAACHLHGKRQVVMADDLLREIVAAAFITPLKSLDVLQGLQLLIAWYHYNLRSVQMANLLFLMRSMCTNLGIGELLLQFPAELSGAPAAHPPDYLELMRAYAGTFYQVALTYNTGNKHDALMDPSLLANCCRTIESRMEYASDGLLVALVRQQQLSQTISQTLGYRASAGEGLPLAMLVASFQQQLQAFKASLAPHVRENPSLAGHMYTSEIILFEKLGLEPATTTTTTKTAAGVPDVQRIELLWQCLHAVKAYLDHRYAQPAGATPPRFICMTSFDFVYAFVTATRLMTCHAPGWDPARVRSLLAFDAYFERQLAEMMYISQMRRQVRRRRRPKGKSRGGGEGDVGDGEDVDIGNEDDDEDEENTVEENDPYDRLMKKAASLFTAVVSER
ncbi:hypothetical protein B0T26DRAFT_702457 [Lasiosphaeria miniovina]|uniref:Uncharacterized protein n=1 Tax=Lasiosphaeria miniovina TaxID=1954250 RepID=A0AA40AUQ2_9PEZI|nr:uncharacterized protein B0T26DRAFT_702457 [Lasiosphaeria miniovina]KAK0722368.1 hypothetical protein B0T26DRAFT_702457 [Lasiosphaeria miniovina]